MDSINGLLIIDKPEGKSSAFIDFIVRKILGVEKAGHIGTLDPFATGVLAIALNNGTKVIPYIKTDRKVYEFEVTFGARTNTSDKTGEIIETSDKIPTVSEIESIIPQFIGDIFQTPSIFSAIKINGAKAYELARKGKIPKIEQRKVRIFNLELIEKNKFRAEVSPGTYIRSLTEDIAKALGSLGYTSSLRRIQDGKFAIENSITLDYLEQMRENIKSVLIPLENVLDDIPVILVSRQDAGNLIQGKQIASSAVVEYGKYLAKFEDSFLEIVEISDGLIIPKKLLRSF